MRIMTRAFACRKPRRSPTDLVEWGKAVVADPARYHATEREAVIVAGLLADLAVTR